jgi:hypothetical protein
MEVSKNADGRRSGATDNKDMLARRHHNIMR